MSALERPLGALRAPTTAPLALAAPADAVARARRRYYFALVVKNQIVYLAMADKSISDIEAAMHRHHRPWAERDVTWAADGVCM